jgi:hypothetical protein
MRGLDPRIHAPAPRKAWMPIAVSFKPLAAAGTPFLREPVKHGHDEEEPKALIRLQNREPTGAAAVRRT